MLNQFLLAGLYIGIFYFLQSRVRQWVSTIAKHKIVTPTRVILVTRFFVSILFFIALSLIALTFGLGYQDIGMLVSSVFAVLGVALFAQWSILSNLTASVLIFFVFPYHIGHKIKVVESSEDIVGVIQEISLFHVVIDCGEKGVVTYPNNLILQKPVVKLQN